MKKTTKKSTKEIAMTVIFEKLEDIILEYSCGDEIEKDIKKAVKGRKLSKDELEDLIEYISEYISNPIDYNPKIFSGPENRRGLLGIWKGTWKTIPC